MVWISEMTPREALQELAGGVEGTEIVGFSITCRWRDELFMLELQASLSLRYELFFYISGREVVDLIGSIGTNTG